MRVEPHSHSLCCPRPLLQSLVVATLQLRVHLAPLMLVVFGPERSCYRCPLPLSEVPGGQEVRAQKKMPSSVASSARGQVATHCAYPLEYRLSPMLPSKN